MKLILALCAVLLLLQMPEALPGRQASPETGATVQAQQTLPAGQAAELDEAHQLNLKAVKLYQEGKFDEALPLAKRSLSIREKVLGREDQLVIQSLINLAEIHLARKAYSDSLSLYERVLKSNEKQIGPDDATNATLLGVIAYLHYMMGQNANAENFYKRALAVSEKSAGPESEQVANSAYNLAEYYRFTKNYQKAEALYQRAFDIRARKLARDDPKMKRTIERYQCLYYQTEQEEKLKAFNRKVNAIYDSNKNSGSANVLNGQALSLPRPPYPQEARSIRATGIVIVKVTIDEQGKVVNAEDVCGGNPWLVKAATQAAYDAHFSRTILSGQPVKVTGLITYKFIL
jgi:TonB family protein